MLDYKHSEIDLKNIYNHTKDLWYDLDGKKLFVTGGTGFFGTWLLKSIIYANQLIGTNIEVIVLSRDPNKHKKYFPFISVQREINFHIGDVTNFEFPSTSIDIIIHCASTSIKEKYLGVDPIYRYQVTAEGTKRVLDMAVRCDVSNFLLISSGSVYGVESNLNDKVDESCLIAPSIIDINSDTCYAEAKRVSEMFSVVYAKKHGISLKIARCFSFIGPHFPLNYYFAIGNFIRDGINGGPIVVKSDGSDIRSYMYSSDLVVWLWKILLRGQSCYPYNVGSEFGISIGDLAKLISNCFNPVVDLEIKKEESSSRVNPSIYVPSTLRAREELGLSQTISLEIAIKKTIEYNMKIHTS